MHKKTANIIENLGYDEEVVKHLKNVTKNSDAKSFFASLKKLGLPDDAIRQIKNFEDLNIIKKPSLSNKNLIQELLKKCKRSLDAFAQKNTAMRIIFKNHNWTIYSEEYNKSIQKLHETCKHHFDDFSFQNLEATIIFDGSTTWRIISSTEIDTDKK